MNFRPNLTVRFAVVCSFFLLVATPRAQAQNRTYPPQFQDAREEVYKSVEEVQLKLWIFEPSDHQLNDRRAAIVFFFGGGWRSGSPHQFEPHCRYLAQQGMVAMVADYRVLNRHGTPAIKCVEDGKSAIRYVRANADRLGIDPDKIVAAGGSAGGHVAACTGVVTGLESADESIEISSRPNALALFNPALMLASMEGVALDPGKLKSIEKRAGIDPKAISPVHHVGPGLPPTIIFHGDRDSTVPMRTIRLYRDLAVDAGNRCELKTYKGFGHGFFNDGREGNPGESYRRTVDQLHRFLRSLGYLETESGVALPKSEFVHLRSHFNHCRKIFSETKQGTVAFIGGSITEMENHGHRGMVQEFLQQRFPETEFQFINAGISSTCSTTGAFRLKRDVIAHDPDLLFVEFAVNDDQDAIHSPENCLRGMEGIIRRARMENPQLDIVMTHFPNDSMLTRIRTGVTPNSIAAHESVARHYGVSSANLAAEVAARIDNETLTWKEYGGTHPQESGNRIAADLIRDLLDTAWSCPLGQDRDHSLPKTMDKTSYFRGRLVSHDNAVIDANWQIGKPKWKAIEGSLRSRFVDDVLLHSDQVGAELKLDFSGTAIGMYVLAGPDAGSVEFSIDDGPFLSADLYHHFSAGLHYPRTVVLANDLSLGAHQLRIRISPEKHTDSRGHAIRILNLVVN